MKENDYEEGKFLKKEHKIKKVTWDECGYLKRIKVKYEENDETDENEIMDDIKNRIKQENLKF